MANSTNMEQLLMIINLRGPWILTVSCNENHLSPFMALFFNYSFSQSISQEFFRLHSVTPSVRQSLWGRDGYQNINSSTQLINSFESTYTVKSVKKTSFFHVSQSIIQAYSSPLVNPLIQLLNKIFVECLIS